MKDYTRIAVILDRSGSMESLCEATVAGYNEFLRHQRELPGECRLRLVQFDDQYETVYDLDIRQVPELTQATFVPRGTTALLDAQGRTVQELGRELAALPEAERPNRVIVCTITDGLENASTQFSAEMVRRMVEEQQNVYGWTFTYIGANQDAIAVGRSMGVPMENSLRFNAQPSETSVMFRRMSDGLWRVRAAAPAPAGGARIDYTDEDRAAAMGTNPA